MDDRDRELVEDYRTWFESAVLAEPWGGTPQRHDRREGSGFATRWPAGRRLWYELAIRPRLPQVRFGLMTDDADSSRDLERIMVDMDLTLQEFVSLGFAAVGLCWANPPVEHYCEQGQFYYFATPLDLKSLADLADPALRERTIRVARGYHHAFSGGNPG